MPLLANCNRGPIIPWREKSFKWKGFEGKKKIRKLSPWVMINYVFWILHMVCDKMFLRSSQNLYSSSGSIKIKSEMRKSAPSHSMGEKCQRQHDIPPHPISKERHCRASSQGKHRLYRELSSLHTGSFIRDRGQEASCQEWQAFFSRFVLNFNTAMPKTLAFRSYLCGN